jgi:serine phosphatase RsbU (regulator of sigma subunit)/PAS domain-containing protein
MLLVATEGKSYAQQLIVSGKLFENKKQSEGVKIQLLSNRKVKDSTYSSNTGYFEMEIPYQGLFLLRFTKFGYVPKNIEIDTKISSQYTDETFSQDVILNFDKAPFGLDLTDLDTAMARIYFSPKVEKFIYDDNYFISKAIYDNLLMKKVRAQENTIAHIQDEIDSLSPAAKKALGLDAKEYELKRKASEWEAKAKASYFNANREAQEILAEARMNARKIYITAYDSVPKKKTKAVDTATIISKQQYLAEQKYLLEIQRLSVRTRDDSLQLFEKEAEIAKQQLSLTEIQSELKIKEGVVNLQQEKLKNRNRLIWLFLLFSAILVSIILFIVKINRQRKKLNIQLGNANEELLRLNVAVSQTKNGIVICNEKGEVLWYNKGFADMLSNSDIEFRDIISSNLLNFFNNEELELSLLNNNPLEFTSVFYFGKVTEKWLRVMVTPIDSTKEANTFIMILSDVTELKNAQKEIELQANHLEIQNIKITDSIRYAKKIQNAILFPLDNIHERFDIFSIFLPKDIVSGDFYYYKKLSEKSYVFAVADCTGHGVPGAFMSLLSFEKLDNIIGLHKKADPALVLTKLDEEISSLLSSNKNDTEDGLEIALVYIEIMPDNKYKVVFSGANRPMFLFNLEENKLDIIKGDKKGIGGKDYYYLDENFTNQIFYITLDSRIYLFSDGLIDLRGNKNKRFGTQNFIELIKKSGQFDSQMQKNEFENIIFALTNETEQRDDITLISIKLKSEWSR